MLQQPSIAAYQKLAPPLPTACAFLVETKRWETILKKVQKLPPQLHPGETYMLGLGAEDGMKTEMNPEVGVSELTGFLKSEHGSLYSPDTTPLEKNSLEGTALRADQFKTIMEKVERLDRSNQQPKQSGYHPKLGI